MNRRFLLADGSCGAFMGECEGMFFWSGVFTAGFEYVVTFPSKEAAMAVVRENQEVFRGKSVEIREIHIVDRKYATKAECFAAGIRQWEAPLLDRVS
jgi:hypothetical protein